jgi:hypothetical protein
VLRAGSRLLLWDHVCGHVLGTCSDPRRQTDAVVQPVCSLECSRQLLLGMRRRPNYLQATG